MSYHCYLGKVEMPVTPSKLTIKVKGQNKSITLLNEGEINVLRSPGLTEITVPLTFPMIVSGKEKNPKYYLDILENLKKNKKTTQFIITRTSPNGKKLLFDTNIKVSVEDYTIKENAKDGLDVSVEIQLKQYRDYSTKVLKIKKKNASSSKKKSVTVKKERSSNTAPKAKKYTVKSGDSLWTIAKKYYGDGSKYKKIYNANKDKVNNPNLIYPGQVLTIP